uniref:Transcriptional adapter 1 n=1 Tax=Eptatretus burgeri TaxID=7764 RepID=A0A8C4WZR3_EPTBU
MEPVAMAVGELEQAKRCLGEALGENSKAYWANMKLWFRQKISKEEFDIEARRLLTHDNVHLHNDFLLSILTKCQIMVSVPGRSSKSSRKKKLPSLRGKFEVRACSISTFQAIIVNTCLVEVYLSHFCLNASVGTQGLNMTEEEMEAQVAMLSACSGTEIPPKLPPAGLYDLLEALQVAKFRFDCLCISVAPLMALIKREYVLFHKRIAYLSVNRNEDVKCNETQKRGSFITRSC